MNDRTQEFERERSDELARDLLAPIYGEQTVLSERESAELEALRDLLHDYAGGHVGSQETSSRDLRSSVLDAMAAPEAVIAAVSPRGDGVTVSRPDGFQDLLIDEALEILPGTTVRTDCDSRADVIHSESVFVALNNSTDFVVGTKGKESLGGRIERGCAFINIDEHDWSVDKSAITLETPQGYLRVKHGHVEVEVEAGGFVRVLVAEGEAKFKTLAGKCKRISEGSELRVVAGRMHASRPGLESIEDETRWARVQTRQPKMFEAVSALVMAAFFIGVAVVRIADASAELPRIDQKTQVASAQVMVRDISLEAIRSGLQSTAVQTTKISIESEPETN